MTEPLTTYVGAVYPWQCDQVGHLNVAFYVAKFDEATWNLFAEIGMDGTYFRERRGGMGAVDQKLTYSRELYPGDCVVVTTSVVELGPRKITFRHDMKERLSNETAATCTITAVHIQPEVRKAAPFPPEVLERAEGLLGGQAK